MTMPKLDIDFDFISPSLAIEMVDAERDFDDEFGEYTDIVSREATISIMTPELTSWDEILRCADFDAAIAHIHAKWQTTDIDIVHEEDRPAGSRRPVTRLLRGETGPHLYAIVVATTDLP